MDLWSHYLRFRPQLLSAVDQSLYPSAWIDAQVYAGLFQFRCTERAAILFEAKIYPSGQKDVHGILAAGDLSEIAEILIPQAEAWGRAHGCSGSIIESRGGWAKLLRGHGYVPHQVAIRKEL